MSAVPSEADLVEAQLVAGEVDDLRCDGHPVGHADGGQVARQELRAAADVRAGEFRAVAMRGVVGLADVARVVEQRDHQAEQRALRAEALLGRVRAFVAHQQPRHGERVVQRVLHVVIDGVAAEIAGKLAVEQPLEVGERRAELLDRSARPGPRVEFLDRATRRRHRAHLHGVGDVVVAAPVLHGVLVVSLARVPTR